MENDANNKQILERLMEISVTLLGGHSQQQVLDCILKGVQAIGFDRVRLYLLSADGQSLIGKAQVCVDEKFVGVEWPVTEDVYMQALLKDPRPRIFKPESGEPKHSEEGLDKSEVEEWACVPLCLKGKVIGQISADNKFTRRAIVDEKLGLVGVFAAQAAAALENAKLFEETERKAEQLEALRRTALAITSQLDRSQLLLTIIEQAVELLKAKSGGIYEYYPERQELTVIANHNRSNQLGLTLKVGEGMAGRLALIGNSNGQASHSSLSPEILDERFVLLRESFMIAYDYNAWPGKAPIYADGREFGAVLEIPLKWQERIIGILYIDDVVERRFTEEDARLLGLFADQSAIALKNADLTTRDEGRLKRLEKLSKATREIMGNLEATSLDERLTLIAKHAREILEAEVSGVLLVKREGVLNLEASYGHVEGGFQKGKEFAIQTGIKTGLTGHIAYEGELFNAHGDALLNHPAIRGERPDHLITGVCHSLLALPLKEKVGQSERLVGLLRAENKKDKDGRALACLHFTEEDEWILNIFAEAVVVALEGTKSVAQLSEQKDRLGLLLKANEIVGQANSLTEGLQRLADLVVSLLSHTFCRILLLDQSGSHLIVEAAHSIPREGEELKWQPALKQRIAISEYPCLHGLFDAGDMRVLSLSREGDRPNLLGLSRRLGLENDIQSLLMVPLKIGTKIVGLLDVGEIRSERASFAKEQRELVAAIAAQITALIDRMRQQQITERRGELLTDLDEASRHIRAEKEMPKLQQEAVRLAVELAGCTAGALFINLPVLKKLEMGITYDLQLEPKSEISHDEGLVGEVARTGKSKIIYDYSLWEGREALLSPFNFDTVIAVPIKQTGDVEAVLMVADNTGRQPSSEVELDILERFAEQVARAFQTSRLISREHPIFRHLSILHKISDYIQTSDNLQKVLHVVLTGITAGYGLGFNRAAFLLLDERRKNLAGEMGIGQLDRAEATEAWDHDLRRGLYEFRGYVEQLEKGDVPTTPVGEWAKTFSFLMEENSNDIFSQAVRGQKGFLIPPEKAHELPTSFTEALKPTAPVVIVPLVARDEVIGLLVADNKFTLATITSEDIEALQTFVNTAAIAIDNIKLIRRIQDGRERLHSLYQASNALISAGDPHQVLNYIVEQTRVAAQASWVRVILIDEMNRARTLIIAAEGKQEGYTDKDADLTKMVRPEGISMQVMQTGDAEVIENTHIHPYPVNPIMMHNSPVSALCLPLSLQGKRIGVMWIHYEAPRYFPQFEIDALQLYVNQAAIAYDNARRMEELDHMHKAAEAVAGASDPQEVLERIVQSARRVLQADSAVIWSYDDVRNIFIQESSVASGISAGSWEAFRKKEPRKGGTAYTVMEKEMIAVEDVDDHRQYGFLGESTRNLLGRIEVCSFLGISLTIKDEKQSEKLGVLYVNYSRPRSFTKQEQQTAQTFANHAALALKKARSLYQVQKARNAARVVAEVTALEDLQSTLEAIVKGTCDALGNDAVTLYTYDKDQDKFGSPAMHGVWDKQAVLRSEAVESPSVVRKFLALDTLYVAEHATTDEMTRGPFSEREEIATAVCIPLVVKDRKVGVMFVNYRKHHRFTADEINNIELFANQAAVAIRNAQLYEQEQKRVIALKALYEAGRAVTGSLDLEKILSRIAEQAWQLVHNQGKENSFVDIKLIEGTKVKLAAAYPEAELLRVREMLGEEIDLEKGKDGRIGILGRAVKTEKAQLINDVTRDQDYLELHKETHSQLVVLIKKDRQIIGSISIEHPDLDAFNKDGQEALESLATQASIAIQNARQMEELQRAYEEMKSVKGFIGSRTALEWIKMVSYSWGHSIRRQAGVALRYTALLQASLDTEKEDQSALKDLQRLEGVIKNIADIPVIPPLSHEEAVDSVQINDLVKTYLKNQWQHTGYEQITPLFNFEPNLDAKVTVRASRAWLRRAIEILVENAVRAMLDANSPRKELTVTTRLIKNRVRISIRDTGPGIPPAALNNLFNKPIALEEGGKGAGIGLMMAQAIVDTYKGRIYVYVRTTNGDGTEMVITLPV